MFSPRDSESAGAAGEPGAVAADDACETTDDALQNSDADNVSPPPGNQPTASGQCGRESVEAIVVTFLLIMMFKTFIGDMYVIPTGSMAPTLMGQHVDVVCPACGFSYQQNASRESQDFDTDGNGSLDDWEQELKARSQVIHVQCPNCGRPHQLQPETNANERSFKGDRIVVGKFVAALQMPRRWDVTVFKYPGNAKVNFIKRLVGMPRELVKIWHGNVYTTPLLFELPLSTQAALEQGTLPEDVRRVFADHQQALGADAAVGFAEFSTTTYEAFAGWVRRINDGPRSYILAEHEGRLHVFADDFRILRKPSRKLLAMLQVVHDAAHTATALQASGWPLRWQGSGWLTSDHGATYAFEDDGANGSDGEQDPESEPSDDNRATQARWLRYRHFEAQPFHWELTENGQTIPATDLPQVGDLIMDGYAYNQGEPQGGPHHWVGDLVVECHVAAPSTQGAVWLELVRAGDRYRCRVDLQTGAVTLSTTNSNGFDAPTEATEEATEAPTTSASGTGARAPTAQVTVGPEFTLRMSNVDDELRVWLNQRELAFDRPTTYRPGAADAPTYRPATSKRPEDPGDTAPVAIGAERASLRVSQLRVLRDIYYVAADGRGRDTDFERGDLAPGDPPSYWLNPGMFAQRRAIYYVLGPDQFFALGDNSPFSSDARRWGGRPTDRPDCPHYVRSELLIGKALLIYWPHAWRPFWPNFQRWMKLVR